MTREWSPWDQVESCPVCGEYGIICYCVRAESCNDCGEYWQWCSCEREGIDVIGSDTFKHRYRCRLVKT